MASVLVITVILMIFFAIALGARDSGPYTENSDFEDIYKILQRTHDTGLSIKSNIEHLIDKASHHPKHAQQKLHQMLEENQAVIEGTQENLGNFSNLRQSGQTNLKDPDSLSDQLSGNAVIAISTDFHSKKYFYEFHPSITPEEKTLHIAEAHFQTINQITNIIQPALARADLSYSEITESAGKLIESIITVNGHLNESEADFIHKVAGQSPSPDGITNFDSALKRVEKWVQKLSGYKPEAANLIAMSLENTITEAIAIDGKHDDDELERLTRVQNMFTSHGIVNGSRNRPEKTDQGNGENTESSPEEELSSLIGLAPVKREIQSLANRIHVNRMREEHGLPSDHGSLHMIFYGNPGTGKTTVARLLARILHGMGTLSKGHLVEVSRSDLVGGYVGQTAIKTREVIEKSLGGILFIDEAYSLSRASEVDFGSEAIEEILKAMEDNRDDMIVIAAGYPNEMAQFITSNPGLSSRFSRHLEFPDYSAEEMKLIFNHIMSKSSYKLTGTAEEELESLITRIHNDEKLASGNARTMRNLFEKASTQHANRIVQLETPTKEELITLDKEDIPALLPSA